MGQGEEETYPNISHPNTLFVVAVPMYAHWMSKSPVPRVPTGRSSGWNVAAGTLILEAITCLSQWQSGLRQGFSATRFLGFRSDPGLESGCLSVVSVVCYQVEVSASGWSLVQGSPTSVFVCLNVIVNAGQWGGPGPLERLSSNGGGRGISGRT